MKILVFGTGNYYSQYKQYINMEDVLFFLDNNKEKWGKKLDQKLIVSPHEVDYRECDFVLILIYQDSEVIEQLLSLGVQAEKIKNYLDIPKLYNVVPTVVSVNGNVALKQWKKESEKRNIFVCSHEFSRTGVPVALMNLCILLKKMGYYVLFSALSGGTLEQEIYDNEIDYITDLKFFYNDENVLDIIKGFDIIFIGAMASSEFAIAVSEVNKPIVWWLHESSDVAYEKYKVLKKDNIYYYAGGKRVVKTFKKYYRNIYIKEMLYSLPDDVYIDKKKNDKVTFAVIGSIEKRKAQDIFVEAIGQIREELKNKSRYIIVGRNHPTESLIDLPLVLEQHPYLEWIDEVSQEELKNIYKMVDVLVCPSRDDPMPIVVTQALQNGIPCIVSDEVGQSEYLINGNGGIVFPSEDVHALAEAMTKYIEDSERIEQSCKEAKNVFKNHFSEATMKKNLEEIFSVLIRT